MKYYFSLQITNKEFLPYYQGQISAINVFTNSGVNIQFPAVHLRQHLDRKGVFGRFCLETKNNKFLSLIKLT